MRYPITFFALLELFVMWDDQARPPVMAVPKQFEQFTVDNLQPVKELCTGPIAFPMKKITPGVSRMFRGKS